MNKKFELIEETKIVNGRTLHRIRALRDIGKNVSAGDLGGWIEKEENLSRLTADNAWIYNNAMVYDNAFISDNAIVRDNASVYGDAYVSGNAMVYDEAEIFGHAEISGYGHIYGNAQVFDNASVYGHAIVHGNAKIYDYANIHEYAGVCFNAIICGNAEVYGDAHIMSDACIYDDRDYTTIKGFGTKCRTTTFFRCADGTIKVTCGCFLGTIDRFRKQVVNTREGKVVKEYLMIADLMEFHFSKENKKND